jgi:DNA polymerase III delta prime subunit
MEYREDQFLWVEKYRPRKLSDCILPADQKKIFEEMVSKGEIQNMLLCGSAGVGKTTVARALCEELETDYIIINGSEESGIDVLRTKIKQFASTVSFSGKTKVVILDEADYLNPNSTQPALRAFIEEFSSNCRFIFTCNFKNRIIPPLHSRCAVIEFKITKEDKPKIASKFFNRIKQILQNESIESDLKVVAKVIEKHFPDYRRILNELQRYSSSGLIDEGILTNIGEVNILELSNSLKEKDWKRMRSWVVNNIDNDPASLFRKIYDSLMQTINIKLHFVLIKKLILWLV